MLIKYAYANSPELYKAHHELDSACIVVIVIGILIISIGIIVAIIVVTTTTTTTTTIIMINIFIVIIMIIVTIILLLLFLLLTNSPELATGADECPSTAMGSSVTSCPPNCATRSKSSGVSVQSLAYACMQKQNMTNCSLIVLWRILVTHWQCFGASLSNIYDFKKTIFFGTNLSLIDSALAEICHSSTRFQPKPVRALAELSHSLAMFCTSLSLIDSALAELCRSLTTLYTSLSLIDSALAQKNHAKIHYDCPPRLHSPWPGMPFLKAVFVVCLNSS